MSMVKAGKRLGAALRVQLSSERIERVEVELASLNGNGVPSRDRADKGGGKSKATDHLGRGARSVLRRNRENVLTLPAPYRPETLRDFDQLTDDDLVFLERYHEGQAATARDELARRAA
jgi:hypothetical protein